MVRFINGNIRKSKINGDRDIIELLSVINPAKSGLWSVCSKKNISVDIKSSLLHADSEEVLINELFPDFAGTLQEISDFFDPDSLEIVCSRPRSFNIPAAQFTKSSLLQKHDKLSLSVFDFAKLYNFIRENKIEEYRVVSIINRNNSQFFYCINENSPLKSIPEFLSDTENTDTGNMKFFNLYTGLGINADMPVTSDLEFLYWGQTPKRLRMPGNLVFTGGKGNRTLGELSASDKITTPCCNCLSCVKECPAGIYPNILFHLLDAGEVEDISKYNISLCTRCGRCSSICPSSIPLYQGIEKHILSGDNNDQSNT